MISKGAIEVLARLQGLRVDLSVEDSSLRFDEPRVPGDLVDAISSCEDEIVSFLCDAQAFAPTRADEPIEAVPTDGALPCSSVQKRLWTLHQLRDCAAAGNMQVCVWLRGRLDRLALRWSLNQVIGRHECLRTRFLEVGGEPVQHVLETARLDLAEIDLSQEADSVAAATSWAQSHANVEFDLTKPPLFAAVLIAVGRDQHLLSVTFSHLIADGWSAWIFWRDLAEIYRQRGRAQALDLPRLHVRYVDYAAWHAKDQVAAGDALRRYWLTKLDQLSSLRLPTDWPRSSRPSFAGAQWIRMIDAVSFKRFIALGAREGCTVFMSTLAACKVLLGHYAGQEDIVVGSPVANRDRVELESVVGPFVNTLVLRTEVRRGSSFRECLRRVRDTTLGALEHQAMPFEQLVDELRPVRTPGMNPLFQVLFKTDAGFADWEDLDDVVAVDANLAASTAKYDLTLGVQEVLGGLRIAFEYRTALFSEETISRMADHLAALIRCAADRPDDPVEMLAARVVGTEQMPQSRSQVDEPRPKGGGDVFVPPRTEAEAAVARVWRSVLEVERIGVHDNFYELGGIRCWPCEWRT